MNNSTHCTVENFVSSDDTPPNEINAEPLTEQRLSIYAFFVFSSSSFSSFIFCIAVSIKKNSFGSLLFFFVGVYLCAVRSQLFEPTNTADLI